MTRAAERDPVLLRVDKLLGALRSGEAQAVDGAVVSVFGPAGAAVLAQLTPSQAQRLSIALRKHRRHQAEAVLAVDMTTEGPHP